MMKNSSNIFLIQIMMSTATLQSPKWKIQLVYEEKK
jgi:hypothetical protein